MKNPLRYAAAAILLTIACLLIGGGFLLQRLSKLMQKAARLPQMGDTTPPRRTVTKYRVTDNPFNRANPPYDSMIGKVYDNPPAYAAVELVQVEVPDGCVYP